MARSCPFAATLSLRRAHSSSGLGHRPLTAAARVRIPYAPLDVTWLAAFGSTTRVICDSGAGYARAVPTPVLPRRVVSTGDTPVRLEPLFDDARCLRCATRPQPHARRELAVGYWPFRPWPEV